MYDQKEIMTQNSDNQIGTLYNTLRRLAGLYVDNAKLTASEKGTELIGALAVGMFVLQFGILALVFLVIGLAAWLDDYLAPQWTFFIVAGLVALLVIAAVLLRKPLIYDPVARFISRLFLDAPKDEL